MLTLKELQKAYREAVELKRAYEKQLIITETVIQALPEVTKLRGLWEEAEKAGKDLDELWLGY